MCFYYRWFSDLKTTWKRIETGKCNVSSISCRFSLSLACLTADHSISSNISLLQSTNSVKQQLTASLSYTCKRVHLKKQKAHPSSSCSISILTDSLQTINYDTAVETENTWFHAEILLFLFAPLPLLRIHCFASLNSSVFSFTLPLRSLPPSLPPSLLFFFPCFSCREQKVNICSSCSCDEFTRCTLLFSDHVLIMDQIFACNVTNSNYSSRGLYVVFQSL